MLADLAMRDGQRVLAFDLFGDLDLRRRASRVVTPVEVGRGGLTALVDAAAEVPARGVVYGASFENHPALVARLGRRHALLGNTPQTLRAVRDPQRLGAVLRDAGLMYPRTFAAAPDGRAGRWLRKPLRGGGGTRVRDWRGGRLPQGTVVQERIGGLACSAAAAGDGTDAVVLGICEQLVGRARVRGPRPPVVRQPRPAAAAGCGARGAAEPGARDLLAPGSGVRAARAVRRRPDLGRRARVDDRGQPASHRVARGDRVARTESACSTRTCGPAPASCRASRPGHGRAAGKAVLFATEDVVIGDSERWLERGVRDVPHPGERIARGPSDLHRRGRRHDARGRAGRAGGAGRAAARGARARGGGGRWLTRPAPGAGAPATTSRRRSPRAGWRA